MNFHFRKAVNGFNREDVINYVKKQAYAMDQLRQTNAQLERELEALQQELEQNRFDRASLEVCRGEFNSLQETHRRLTADVSRVAEELTLLISAEDATTSTEDET
ncbi:MAG: hypothetical protein MJ075_00770 [Oscillospiraceae bacterium]|nr:hypothetical protein [Oscillospiraceae bacterium]